MVSPVHYAFVDESGTEAPFSQSHFLVVALLSAIHERDVVLPVQRACRKYGGTLASGEMKADASPATVSKNLLRLLADAPIEIIATVVDKRCILRPPADPGEIYRKAVVSVTRHAVKRWPNIAICLDKRYTTTRERNRLWAIFQKYERGNSEFYRIIEDNIVVEELVAQELW
jgi:hypothetical protein